MSDRHCLRITVVILVLVGFRAPAFGAGKGLIRGAVDKAGVVTAVTAIDRATDKKYLGTIDAKTGQFTIKDLPLGTYDCVLDVGPVRLEGVNLKVPRSDYEEEQPLSKEDIETIKTTARSLNKFENEIEILTVSGNIQHAAVMLNKKRTTPFYESKPGEMIWRLELWHFEKPDETWIKVQEEFAIVFYRQRLQKSDFAKKALTLDPQLGGIKLNAKQPIVEIGRIALPSKEPGIRIRITNGRREPVGTGSKWPAEAGRRPEEGR